jgi:hypothetical protein
MNRLHDRGFALMRLIDGVIHLPLINQNRDLRRVLISYEMPIAPFVSAKASEKSISLSAFR